MPRVHVTTFIEAPKERVFDLCRSISMHKISLQHTNENAINGITNGLIQLGETVTWEATHFGKKRIMGMKITEMEFSNQFVEVQTHGYFKSYKHQHFFKPVKNGTIMIDYLDYEMPYGIIGYVLDALLFENYLNELLTTRNNFIKKYAETDLWKALMA